MTGSMSAADAAVLFDGARLTLARQLAGMKKSELAAVLGKSPTAIAGFESGKRPSATTVAQLAMRLGVNPAFFAVSGDGVADLMGPPHFRSLRATTQVARDQAVAFGQLAVDITAGMETHVEFPEVDVPRVPVDGEDTDDEAPAHAARVVREAWGIPDGPVGHLVRLMENHGVLVVFSPPQTSSVDAYSFDSQQRPVVVLNPLKRDYYRQRFDLAHELGHIVMHTDAEPGGRVVEAQAHAFARELLMPEGEVAPLLPHSMAGGGWNTLAQLKEQWGVSMQALLLRARYLGILGDVSYRNAMIQVSSRGWRRHEPGRVQVLEQPSLLPKALELLGAEGIDESVLAAQCRAPLELFRAATSRTPLGDPTVQENEDAGKRRAVIPLLPVSLATGDPETV